ncbi:MAG TPA: gephyrin-like molybdotransferase Glp [Actinomycetaceae bacterium]|nr:gephyrin-like molybdotransferase Glp [Actinomycetaceae bacterium]
MITVEEHRADIDAAVEPLAPRRFALAECHGLVLAEDVTAQLAVPPFDNSAMDGYAVRRADLAGARPESPVRLPVVADVPAGVRAEQELPPGRAMRIMTGAPMPLGADAVVAVEDTDQPLGAAAAPTEVAIFHQPAPARHIRRAGEDIDAGAAVLARGEPLRGIHISAAASVGRGELLAHPRPRIGVLATGDEIRPPGSPLGPGQIPDSNTALLTGLLREAGAEPVTLPAAGDDPQRFEELLAASARDLDGLVTSGGVSVGAFDVVKTTLGEGRGVAFRNVAMQPGKPQGFGLLDGALPVFCLPGNPVSVMVSFEVFVRPALLRMAGRAPDPAPVPAVAAEGWGCPLGRRQYIPVRIDDGPGGPPRVRPASGGGSGSHLVASLAGAQGLAVVAAEVEAVAAGDAVALIDMRSR